MGVALVIARRGGATVRRGTHPTLPRSAPCERQGGCVRGSSHADGFSDPNSAESSGEWRISSRRAMQRLQGEFSVFGVQFSVKTARLRAEYREPKTDNRVFPPLPVTPRSFVGRR